MTCGKPDFEAMPGEGPIFLRARRTARGKRLWKRHDSDHIPGAELHLQCISSTEETSMGQATLGRSRWRQLCGKAWLVIALAAASTGASAQNPDRPEAEKSSLDDCKIIIAVGKNRLGWSSAAAPTYDFYPRFRDYVEDCPWKELGVAEPRIGTRSSVSGFFISRPIYDGSSAAVEIYSFRRVKGVKGKALARAPVGETCKLDRDRSEWSIKECSATSSEAGPVRKGTMLINPIF